MISKERERERESKKRKRERRRGREMKNIIQQTTKKKKFKF